MDRENSLWKCFENISILSLSRNPINFIKLSFFCFFFSFINFFSYFSVKFLLHLFIFYSFLSFFIVGIFLLVLSFLLLRFLLPLLHSFFILSFSLPFFPFSFFHSFFKPFTSSLYPCFPLTSNLFALLMSNQTTIVSHRTNANLLINILYTVSRQKYFDFFFV